MNIKLKSQEEIKIMQKAGAMLAEVREKVKSKISPGISAIQIEELANQLIKEKGAIPSFKTVPGYKWATCINVNDGVAHGIPKKQTVFQENDLVSVDLGLFFNGYHTDTSFTVYLGKDPDISKFLNVGREALNSAIKKAKPGNKVGDISMAYEKILKKIGANPIESLVGHGIGRELHEDPMVPCYVSNSRYESVELQEGMVLALEVMYAKGSPDLKLEDDGWTLSTRDGKISALFEETVAVLADGPLVLTR